MIADARTLLKRLHALADPRRSEILRGVFKTGPGQYGEGDQFIGITVPRLRALSRECGTLPLPTLLELLRSPIHEARLFALIGLVRAFAAADESEKRRIYAAYLANTQFMNNWDLVDSSAEYIVGAWLADRDRKPLYRLARSKSLWERRIAIVATFHFIKRGEWLDTLSLAERLLGDEHDLMHKATGWMLREVGKRASLQALEKFLRQNAPRMPRTMLRYAIERLPESRRRFYMKLR